MFTRISSLHILLGLRGHALCRLTPCPRCAASRALTSIRRASCDAKVALHMFGPRKSACLANMAPMLLPQPWPQNRGEWCEGSGWSKMLLLVLGHPPSIFLLESQCSRCAAPKASKTDRVTRSHHLRKRVCGLNRGPLRTKTQGIGSR